MMSEYVTVVSVDLQPNGGTINNVINEHEKKSSFVTVLSINNNQNTTTISTSLESSLNGEIVTVYRLPGERLGFGLKFQGGTKTNEKVERLFIQSCDPESPASKARASWGPLGEGDEILQIDHEPVTNMTRIDCVKCLKDRNVAINLLVRKADSNSMKIIKNESSNSGTKRPLLPPPPPKVPPRKIIRKPPTIVPPQSAPKIVMETPVAAETYLNCTLDDDLTHNDESDETGSTISSQISVISNFSSESDLSLLSTTNASNSDLTRILTKPFQMIEREFNVKNSSVVKSPMSIDNLLLFNQSEHGDFNGNGGSSTDDIKSMMSNYVNVQAKSQDDERQYENIDIDIKVPVPRPRSISLPKEAHCEIDAKTPTKTIESWLNDAKAVNGDKNVTSDSDHAQSYEPIKFECFAAGDDEEEKLGPPELLSISEAYFNFPWCTNASACLPTIGEAEEEFSSIEPAQQQFAQQKVLINGPIFIVHETDSVGYNEIDPEAAVIHQSMEINNNHSPYLHASKDKGDIKLETGDKMQREIIRKPTVVENGAGCEKLMENSVNKKVQGNLTVTSCDANSMDSQSDTDKFTKSHNEHENVQKTNEKSIEYTKTNESAKTVINNYSTIKFDSERLDLKEMTTECTKTQNNTTIASQTSFVKEEKTEMTQSTEIRTDDKTSTTVESSSHKIFEETMEQKHLSVDQKKFYKKEEITANSRTAPDGIEFTANRTTMHTKTDTNSTSDANKFATLSTTTKATAIVAPQRKTHHFEEITNFVDTKPPFKSATLGRQRSNFNWRNKDEKSEKSVKDKIAMFSNSTSDISHILPKSTTFKEKSNAVSSHHRNGAVTKSIENIFSSSSGRNGDSGMKSKVNSSIRKKAMSVENLDDYNDDYDGDECVIQTRDDKNMELNYIPVSKPMSLHSRASMSRPLLLNMNRAQSVEHLSTIDSSPILPLRPPPTAPISLSRRISFNGQTGQQPSNEEVRQKSIANILENRKKSMSKLRGLVIPEKVPESDLQPNQKVVGLPVIRSKECELINNNQLFKRSISTPVKTLFERKSEFEQASLIKPAPRKSLDDDKKIMPPAKPPRTSLILSSQKSSASGGTDESDTESCMSSRISTPPISPVAKKPLTRTLSSNSSLSSNSTLNSGSGSQASCSSNGSGLAEARKNSIKSAEITTSRKSIVASSKSRSGRDCLDKSWRDEDSTDGGIDNDEKQRVPKAKARSSLTNYKLISPGDVTVDKVINVATYVEVMSSDSEDKLDASESMSSVSTQKTVTQVSTKTEMPMNDMAKWMRKEVSKTTTETAKKETGETRTLPKALETPKKLNLSEIRKNFESKATTPSSASVTTPRTPSKDKSAHSNHNRFSSWDSIASSSSGVSSELLGTGTGANNSESLQTIQSDFGSFSSFGSSHSLITPQDLQLIIDEADPPLETSEAFVVVLHRETPESSIGITLAGGSDYEAKEITIHRILTNSPADKDGRLKRGDRLLSINGLSMRGLTHRESLSVLKAPRTDVVMVVTRSKSAVKTNSLTKTLRGSLGSLTSLTERTDSNTETIAVRKSLHASRSIDVDLDAISNEDSLYPNQANGNIMKQEKSYFANDTDLVNIIKDGTGIGIALDGGYDSPRGNKPLIIKKIFMGGAAEKLSNLKAGDEILEINGVSTAKQSRIDVWNMLKKIPQGDSVQLKIKKN